MVGNRIMRQVLNKLFLLLTMIVISLVGIGVF